MDDLKPEQSPNPGRTAEAKAYHEKRKHKAEQAKSEKDFVYKVNGDKVIKVSKTNGKKYSDYVGTVKECAHLLPKK